MGDIEIAFFPKLAPVTAAHILKLFKLGCYNSNHFFRVSAFTPRSLLSRFVKSKNLQEIYKTSQKYGYPLLVYMIYESVLLVEFLII